MSAEAEHGAGHQISALALDLGIIAEIAQALRDDRMAGGETTVPATWVGWIGEKVQSAVDELHHLGDQLSRAERPVKVAA